MNGIYRISLAVVLAAGVAMAQTSENNARLKAALKKYPQADADKDGVLTRAEAQKFMQKMQGQGGRRRGGRKQAAAYPVKPTFADVAYGEFDRNILDFWQADTEGPAPMLVYIHGGGFKSGSKEKLAGRGILEKALENGMHCASINYRYQYNSEADIADEQKTSLAGCFLGRFTSSCGVVL